MNNIGLFLDDARVPVDKPSFIDEWRVVKNYKEFCSFIEDYVEKTGALPAIISLDHDLHEEHYTKEMRRNPLSPIFYSSYKEKTGLGCAEWLCNFCENKDIQINGKIALHSDNDKGNSNIEWVVTQFIKKNNWQGTVFKMKWKYK